MVDQEISQHRVAEGSADERCHHRVSQGRAPLSQTESAKESGHYLYSPSALWSALIRLRAEHLRLQSGQFRCEFRGLWRGIQASCLVSGGSIVSACLTLRV